MYISKYFTGIVAFILLFISFADLRASEVNIAVSRGPVTLDPRYATDAASVRILNLLAPGIIKLDKDFQPTSMFLSYFGHKKYKKFFLELKPNVTYSDGSKVTVFELKKFYDSILDKNNKSPLRGAFSMVENITIENSKRLIFNLNKPNPFFWGALETSVIKLNGNEKKNPVGLGIYKLKQYDNFANISLERLDGRQTLNFKVIKDPVVRYLKLAKGDVDIIHNDIGEEILRYGSKEGFDIYQSPASSYSYMGFLLSHGKTADVKVRKALSYALNRGKIIKSLLGGRASGAYSLLSNDHPAYYKADISKYNPKFAEKLLDEAGYFKGEDGMRFSLRLSITSNPFIARLAQVIQQDFANIGVEVKISSSEWGTFYGNIKKGNFESYILTWVGRFQSDIYRNLFHSSMMPPNGANRGRYNSKNMDILLDKMMVETNDKRRHALVRKIQMLQEEDMIYLPLWKRNHVALVAPKVRDYFIPEDGGYEGLVNTFIAP